MNFQTRSAIAAVAMLMCATATQAASARLYSDPGSAAEAFAAGDIEQALRARKFTVTRRDGPDSFPFRDEALIYFDRLDSRRAVVQDGTPPVDAPKIRAEGFSLRHALRGKQHVIVITSHDAAGAMYGGLELAEQIRTRGVQGVADTDRNPYMSMRGTKFNIPLDLRTPSYSDMSDSAQANIITVWDFDFWRVYLDKLARDRYNFVSLWNLHPFPSMVKVPEYPDIALQDVWRSNIRFDEDYSTRTVGIVTPAMLADKTVVRQLTIEQKIDFWRRVMQYAKDRNIDFYVVTWNIFTYGVDGKYGITDTLDNPKTVDYFRASVREMFRTYPLLAGIGLTAGENMGEISSIAGGAQAFQAKENWVFATYGQGVLDAARAEPERHFRLIHRQHETRAKDIAATFKPVIGQPNVDFVFSFKYAQAHVLSSTTQTFHRGYLESLGDLRTLWTLRNDDALLYRWAAPDFVREFVMNIPYGKSQGYYFGSDMWVWGREFLARQPDTPRQLEIEKHWLHFLLWGRLGYDPTLDDARIAQLIEARFPGVDGAKVLSAWQDASMIYPLVTGFHWADFDFQWYIEGCRSRPEPAKTASGFHSVETFIKQKAHPGTDNLTIPVYVAGITKGETMAGVTPLQVADRIDARADAALGALRALKRRAPSNGKEFLATANDVFLMATLGKYYAAKIRGATELALYRATRGMQHSEAAIRHLQRAAEHWSTYSERASATYGARFWTNRVGHVDWEELTREVQHDVEIARAPLP
jgi:hypothetical protein